MQVIKDIIYGTQAPKSQILDLFLPDGDVTDLFIYFHGGGLEAGDKRDGSDTLPDYLLPLVTRYGKAVISANYRMYPTAVFPEFVEDAASVVAWAKEHIREYCDIQRIFVGGSSAGAWLTAMLAYAPDYLAKHGIKTTDIAGYVIDSAQMTTHFNVLRERGLNTKLIRVDDAAPVYYLNEHTAFPDILVLVSDHDMPCRLEQNLMFLKTLEMLGCPAQKVTYKLLKGFTHTGYLKEGSLFPDLVAEYIDSVK